MQYLGYVEKKERQAVKRGSGAFPVPALHRRRLVLTERHDDQPFFLFLSSRQSRMNSVQQHALNKEIEELRKTTHLMEQGAIAVRALCSLTIRQRIL